MGFWPSNFRGWIGAGILTAGIALSVCGGYRIGSRIELMKVEGINRIDDIYEGREVRRISDYEKEYRYNSMVMIGAGLGIAATGAMVGAIKWPVVNLRRERRERKRVYDNTIRSWNELEDMGIRIRRGRR